MILLQRYPLKKNSTLLSMSNGIIDLRLLSSTRTLIKKNLQTLLANSNSRQSLEEEHMTEEIISKWIAMIESSTLQGH
jgi:hypothetical protein